MARSSTGGPQLPLFDASSPLSPQSGANNLFIGLQPDAPAIAGIRSMTERLRGTYGIEGALRSGVLHVTLAYLGRFAQVPRDRVEIAQQVAQAVRCPPFDVRFDRVKTFPDPAREALGEKLALVLCRDDDDRCAALDTLRSRLVRELVRRGIFQTEDRAFRPHVTLLYDPKKIDPMAVEPICWTVREFVLVYSLHGRTLHRVLARYPLH